MSEHKQTSIMIHCTKCKEKTNAKDIKWYTFNTKNGKIRHYVTGICAKCGKKNSSFGSKEYFNGHGLLSFIPYVGPILDAALNNADKAVDVVSNVQSGINSLKAANDARRKASGKGLYLPSGGEINDEGKGLYLPTGRGIDTNEIRVLKQAAKIIERL